MANFNLNLVVLRAAARVALKAAALVKGQARYEWLGHYLAGTGETLYMPARHVEEILPTLAEVWASAYEEDTDHLVSTWGRGLPRGEGGARVGFWSTTLYEGRGFGHRPEAFYLVGCFTYTVKFWRDQVTGNRVVTVVGADRYDWHSTDYGEYYTSPTAKWFAQVMGWIFGKEYFPSSGFPMGEPGISNRLWADMVQVGAKPFKTRFEATISQEEWLRMAGGDPDLHPDFLHP
jgi:hypothetical protein